MQVAVDRRIVLARGRVLVVDDVDVGADLTTVIGEDAVRLDVELVLARESAGGVIPKCGQAAVR
jgi:hypothetical protein